MLKSVAKEEKVTLVNIFEEVKKVYNYASFDGGHLTSEGHQKIFELVKEGLVKDKLL